jgi:hypothetical protein
LADKSNPLIEIVTDIIPILNGRDNKNNPAYLGPNKTKIHRYLLTLYLAKGVSSFSLWGKNFGSSIFFTLYSLGNVAKAFREPINYDRTKVAINVYKKAEEKGLVEFKKADGETYITMTSKGEQMCVDILKDFIAIARIHGESTSDDRFTSKGVNILLSNHRISAYSNAVIQRILSLNSDFGEVDS